MALYCSRPIKLALAKLNHRSIFSVRDSLRISDAFRKVKNNFERENIPEPEMSSKYLLSQVLGETRPNGFLDHEDRELEGRELEELKRVVSCRLARVPIQYISGNWDFREITIKVRPPVFIPRPETEQLVEIVLQRLPNQQQLNILEVGPGSGNICLSLLKERSNTTVTALERSKLAADLVRENARDLGLNERLNLLEMKVDEETQLTGTFDALVSNPPYVLRKDLMALDPEISLYEDLRALDGGAEGLDVILNILKLAEKVLTPEGQVFLEVDPCHPMILPDRLSDQKLGFTIAEVLEDFNGKNRFLVLTRST